MKDLSDKELEIVAYLEFEHKYFFIREKTRYATRVHKLLRKSRIISLSKRKIP